MPPVNQQTIEGFSQADQEKFADARATLQRVTRHHGNSAPEIANDNDPGNAAMRQKAVGLDKAQPALSPTDQAHGLTALEAPQQGVEASTPSQAPPTPQVDPGQSYGVER